MLRLFQVILDAGLLLVIASMHWLMPALTRRDLLFGVTVPANARETPLGQSIIRRYRLAVLGLTLLCALALALLAFFAPDAWWAGAWSGLFVLIMLAPLASAYLWAHAASQQLKEVAQTAGMPPTTPPEPVADLHPRHYSDTIPLFWEALPLAIIAATAIALATSYATAPAIIPTHFNAAGVANAYSPKTIGTYFLLVWFQLGLYAFLTALTALLVTAKAQPGRAAARFRAVWMRYLFGVKTLLMLWFASLAITIANAASTGSAASLAWVLPASLGFVAVILVSAVILATRTGQGGARLGTPQETATDRLDDRYWKAGAIYVNRSDPAIFVEKRFGVGWTLNFGNPKAALAFVLLLVVAIGLPVVLSLLKAK